MKKLFLTLCVLLISSYALAQSAGSFDIWNLNDKVIQSGFTGNKVLERWGKPISTIKASQDSVTRYKMVNGQMVEDKSFVSNKYEEWIYKDVKKHYELRVVFENGMVKKIDLYPLKKR